MILLLLHYPIPIRQSVKTLLDVSKIPFAHYYERIETFELSSHLLAQFPVKTKQKQIVQPLGFPQHISMTRHLLYDWPILVLLLVTSMVISQSFKLQTNSTILWTCYQSLELYLISQDLFGLLLAQKEDLASTLTNGSFRTHYVLSAGNTTLPRNLGN